MNFHGRAHRDEPEINLIAFIDILLVVVIFLVLTTTYSKYTELKVNLPVADAEAPKQNPREVVVAVGADGRYAVNRRVIEGSSVEQLTAALQESAQGARETAELAAAHLNIEPVDERALADGFSRQDALELLHAHDAEARVLIVGHEPSFSQVVHDFTGARVDFKKGGIAAVRVERGSGELLVLLRPRELETMAQALDR